jgi:hypothetical protein
MALFFTTPQHCGMTSKGEFFGELEVEFEAAVDYELWFDL